MLSLVLSLCIFGGTSGKIQGQVIDADTGDPIPYANVVILNTDLGTATDEDGTFFILNVLSDIYTVEISCVGYQTHQITDVIVETNQTARLRVLLKQAPIEMEPITVISETPYVQKDWTSTTYIIRKSEIATLPIDYTTSLIAFQPSVANLDTALHVRGGRATEVLYLIDNVSIIDPQTGDPAINISKGVIDEIIFLPGGFDAEYGRAMSGVINLITEHPANCLHAKVYGKTERIMPFYYDFGYENVQSSLHLPVTKNFKGLVSLDIMHTDDWNPKLYKLPHKQRDDYSLYGKWVYIPSSKITFNISSILSRSQFDRYAPAKYRYVYDDYRSDFRKGNLQALNVNFMPDSRKFFNVTLSRLFTGRTFGVKENKSYGLFEDFEFSNYYLYTYHNYGIRNPWGVLNRHWFQDGTTYDLYQDKSSSILKAQCKAVLQIHKYNEINVGFDYTYLDLKNFTYLLSNDTIHPITDEYQYTPIEYSAFLQDNIDYKGLYAKAGCRYDYFSGDIEGVEPKVIISPRLGFSFMVTDRFLFRANIGKYAQPPLYDHMYSYYQLIPYPYSGGIPGVVGNPDMEPEKTMSYEIGLQGAMRQNLGASITAFYKDISNLVGTRIVAALQRAYAQYFNVEFANSKGIEAMLDFSNSVFTGRISYTLSWTRGTSSYAYEVYDIIQIDTTYVPEAKEYYLDFDQRHRFFIQGLFNLPLNTELYVFGYIGQGFPYTPPGPEGKYRERNIVVLPFRRQLDCVISKSFKIGKVKVNTNFEIINALDVRYEIAPHGTFEPLSNITMDEFNDYLSFTNYYYGPAADFNHDGLITPPEEYLAYRAAVAATDDWVNANSAPRRARIGVTITFQ
ncbi:MAG: TonB-dependent receptor [bacterium]